jgi:phosphosulfolactate synthase
MVTNFLNTPKRARKPRDIGVTSLIDNGVPTRYFEDVIESTPELVDVVKFGWCTAMVTDDLGRKIECLKKHNVAYYFGGTLFEKALSQKKLDAFYQFVKQHDCQIVEISDGTLDIAMAEKARHIKDFAREFHVISEVGKKDIDKADNMPVSAWIEAILNDLYAGAEKVILESRESGMSGICDASGNLRAGLVQSIGSSRFRITDAIWEAPTKKLQTTLISTFGPNVNLGNIAFSNVIALETLRLGIRSDTFHLYDTTGEDFAVAIEGRAPFRKPDNRRTAGFLADRKTRA